MWAVGQEEHGCSPPRPRNAWHENTLRDCVITVVAAPLNMLFKPRLYWRESPRVWGMRALIQPPSAACTQYELERVTMPSPQ